MDFLISQQHIGIVYLVFIGFVIGVFGGFFGVGGSFLAGPALFSVGMPMHFVVGTDLAHIVGKSIVAARKHWSMGNVDMKLALLMVIGTIIGSEIGAQGIQALRKTGATDTVVGVVFVIVLMSVSAVMAWELWRLFRKGGKQANSGKGDASAFSHVSKAAQRIKLRPMVALPQSGIQQISIWVILATSLIGGLFSGFLGGGAGYIRMPLLVYVLGVPTHVAVGTDLFEVVISASYGTFSHAMKGNVDIMVALVMHTGAAIGAQIGALATQYFTGPKIRLAFIPLPLIGAGLIIYRLLALHHLK